MPLRLLDSGIGSGLLMLVAGCGQADSAASSAPALVCAQPVVDFGQVWQGTVLEHEFLLEVGRADDGDGADGDAVSIRTATADCGCTVAELEICHGGEESRAPYELGAPITPGDHLHVGVRYDTHGKRGNLPRTVSLQGAAPGADGGAAHGTTEGELTRLTLRADVVPWLVVTPPRVDLPPLDDGGAAEATYRVESADGTPFRLTHTRLAVPDQVVARLEPEGPDESGRAAAWSVLVTLGPGLPRGAHVYPIELRTDVPHDRGSAGPPGNAGGFVPAGEAPDARAFFSAMAYVSVQVVGPVSVSPPSLSLGVVAGDQPVARTVRVVGHDPDFTLPRPSARLVPLKPDEPFPLERTAQITIRPVEGENAWDVELLLDGLDPEVQRTFLARLVVETSHPDEPVLEVPITGFHLQPGTLEKADR